MTYRDDISADLVVAAAQGRDTPVYRFNSEDYPARIGLRYDPVDPSSAVLIDGPDEVVLADAGIWIRRPRWPSIDPTVADPADRRFAVQEAVAGIGGLWRVLAPQCVSPPDALQAARWKPAQMFVAARLGFRVPKTMVSTDQKAAEVFVSSMPAIGKAVSEARVARGAVERIGSTEAIVASDDLRGVRLAPVTIQERIEKTCDIRVTLVGKRSFAVRIYTPNGAPIDFRETEPDACRYEPAVIDPTTLRRCERYLDYFGLRFGAFDFVEDSDGVWWFLECNPNGQWGWLEPFTGFDITGAIVDLLLEVRPR